MPVNGDPAAPEGDPGQQPEVPLAGNLDPTATVPGPGADSKRPLQAGEGLVLLDFAPSVATVPPDLGGVTVGSRTLATLHNGNFFVGRVKSVAAESCTMRVGDGEVTLMLADVQRFSPLASEDYETLLQGTAGFLRLNNSNRLVGAVLREVADDYIVLQMRSGRITLPRATVGQIVANAESAQDRVAAEADETWLRKMAERALQQRATGTPKKSASSAPPASKSQKPAPAPKATKPAPGKRPSGPARK